MLRSRRIHRWLSRLTRTLPVIKKPKRPRRRSGLESLESRYALTGSPIEVQDISALEGPAGWGIAIFQVNLQQPISDVLVVDYSTVDGSAVAGSDYEATSGTL